MYSCYYVCSSCLTFTGSSVLLAVSSPMKAASPHSMTDFLAKKLSGSVCGPTGSRHSSSTTGSPGQWSLLRMESFFKSMIFSGGNARAGVTTVGKTSFRNLDQNLVLQMLVSFALGAKWLTIKQTSASTQTKRTIFVIWVYTNE